MKGSSIYWLVGLTCSISILVVFGIYRCHFPGNFLDTRSDWGTFGDYFGGILNPILAVVNIVLLAIITVRIAKVDDERFEKSNKIQKEVALYDLKHTAFVGAVAILNAIAEDSKKFNPQTLDKLSTLRNQLFAHLAVYSHLIEGFKNEKDKLFESIQFVIGAHVVVVDSRLGSGDPAMAEDQFGDKLASFYNLIDEFVTTIQKEFDIKNN